MTLDAGMGARHNRCWILRDSRVLKNGKSYISLREASNDKPSASRSLGRGEPFWGRFRRSRNKSAVEGTLLLSALKNFRQRTNIIIKPADKGSAVVVLSKDDYINEANRQLNESVYHRKLPVDPTSQYTMEVKQCVDSMYRRGLIDRKAKNFIVPHHPRAARFYLLPKIHKPENPGRPIVA